MKINSLYATWDKIMRIKNKTGWKIDSRQIRNIVR